MSRRGLLAAALLVVGLVTRPAAARAGDAEYVAAGAELDWVALRESG